MQFKLYLRVCVGGCFPDTATVKPLVEGTAEIAFAQGQTQQLEDAGTVEKAKHRFWKHPQ